MTTIHYRSVGVDGLKVFYREVGKVEHIQAASIARIPDYGPHVP
jgi:hypothetical protein